MKVKDFISRYAGLGNELSIYVRDFLGYEYPLITFEDGAQRIHLNFQEDYAEHCIKEIEGRSGYIMLILKRERRRNNG